VQEQGKAVSKRKADDDLQDLQKRLQTIMMSCGWQGTGLRTTGHVLARILDTLWCPSATCNVLRIAYSVLNVLRIEHPCAPYIHGRHGMLSYPPPRVVLFSTPAPWPPLQLRRSVWMVMSAACLVTGISVTEDTSRFAHGRPSAKHCYCVGCARRASKQASCQHEAHLTSPADAGLSNGSC
jgi:hypothetical protein